MIRRTFLKFGILLFGARIPQRIGVLTLGVAPAKLRTVIVTSGMDTGCEHCGKVIESAYDMSIGVNHYLDHGYVLLHVGQGSSPGDNWHYMEAILREA